ncbi:MAG TPA: carboxylesterase family protein [Steroidobacteraceae bacterium]|nr:carboxylesterase family protein [Steroidobacteraceae bacterium]
MRYRLLLLVLAGFPAAVALADPAPGLPPLQVRTANGIVEGVDESGIRLFRGVPYAAPPLGELRWKEPQPVRNWTGVRKADRFSPRAMQEPLFSDMVFRSDGISEDCLYLNIWTPARSDADRLPVLVYFYGGGLMAGDGSELRYDGESMSRHGIVAVTVNYRLGVFGFLAHPELTQESAHHASGNYGYLDQAAALRWVVQNIATFGGDARRITIAGESSGSYSVSALMASPLSRGLIAGAIGESGSTLGSAPIPLAAGEKNGVTFQGEAGARSLAELRRMPAQQVLDAASKHDWELQGAVVDGHFFTKPPVQVYAAAEQAHVPLLAGWNLEESDYHALLGDVKPTRDHYLEAVRKQLRGRAEAILTVYDPATDEEVIPVADDLMVDQSIAFDTWKWLDMHARTGGKPVYRYLFARARPLMRSEAGRTGITHGAVHSTEIEYALGNLPTNRVYDWQPEDYKVSAIMQAYFVSFIKTGDPNGLGSANWPAIRSGAAAEVMRIDVDSRVEREQHRDRYLYLDRLLAGD